MRRRPECLFGPVVIDPPTGDAALRLWDATTAWLEFPYLFELQRPRTASTARSSPTACARTSRPATGVSINRGKVVSFD